MPDQSLRQFLQERRVNPSLGIKHKFPGIPTISLRMLIPEPTPYDLPDDDAKFQATDQMVQKTSAGPWTNILSLCSSTQLYYQTDSNNQPLNIIGKPLKIGDSFRVFGAIHFLAGTPEFLACESDPHGLKRQEFRFVLGAMFPDGTGPGEDSTLYYNILKEHVVHVPYSEFLPINKYDVVFPPILRLPAPAPSTNDHGIFDRQLHGEWDLQRDYKLCFYFSVKLSGPFAPNQLGIRLYSLVGYIPYVDLGGGFYGDDSIGFGPYQRVLCIVCKRIVNSGIDSNTCPLCGATGSYIMQPVAPKIIDATIPFGIQ